MELTAKPSAPDLLGRKILIVDNDRMNTRILSGILKPEGYVLSVADSGESALTAYAGLRPDLVLLDVVMPGLNGFETCRALKEAYGDGCAPVIFITAMNESDDIVEGLNAGGVDYLPKPFHAKEVVARIRLHLQNRLLIEQQKLLVEQLNKADAAKNRFLGMAAHDLRNPLTSIRGLAEFLAEGKFGALTPGQLDIVNTMQAASQTMLEQVNDLLDVATIEAGGLKIHLAPHGLAGLITQSVARAGVEAVKKGTRIVIESGAADPAYEIDRSKLQQVADNLLSNAVKYSPPGSIVTVLLFTDPAHGTGGFCVQDMGPGIPEGERARLFQDFGRLSVQPTGGEKSTGLGLAICRHIVSAHHGTITGTNLPGRGCEFRVTLPVPSP